MALAFITQNGKGLGHLVRTRIVCAYLRNYGVRPIVFAQGERLERHLPQEFVRCVPHFWKLSDQEQHWIARDIIEAVRLSDPAVVLEDTHPLDYEFPPEIQRALILRPTTASHFLEVLNDSRLKFARIFVADHPESPTWPYSPDDWREITRRRDIIPIGPLFSRTNPEAIREASDLAGKGPFCVISAGGGGQISGKADIPLFIEHATAVAERILRVKPDMRFLFVKGPFFPSAIEVPDPFTCIEETELMPALFALAHGAIVRPGFNSTWECLASSTPMYPILGETFEEPVEERLRTIRRLGLVSDSPENDWWNPAWRSEFEKTSATLTNRWTGYPLGRELPELACNSVATEPVAPKPKRRVLLVSVNGIGMGHVTRTLRLSKRLIAGGAEVRLALETSAAAPPEGIAIPTSLLADWPYEPETFAPYSAQLETILDAFDPHCVVFDRHYPLPEGLASMPQLAFRETIAIASLPSPGLLANLLADTDVAETFLLHSAADFRQLYGDSLTRLVEASDRVSFSGGPILDRNPVISTSRVPVPRQQYVLWLLGGGGEHEGIHDTETIAGLVSDLAEYLRREHELHTVLIHGPYFQHKDLIRGAAITSHRSCANLAELIRKARLTIFRPGFNLSREVYGSASAYIALDTYQSEEATQPHLRFLAERDSGAVSKLDFTQLVARTESLLKKQAPKLRAAPWHNSAPRLARRLLQDDRAVWTRAAERFSSLKDKGRVLVRIDDVVSSDLHLSCVLAELAKRRIPASLEVIPFLADLREAWLANIDPDASLFEVSQHGFAHVNIQDGGEQYGEFRHPIGASLTRHLRALQDGMSILTERFGERFRGGFSPPFDNLPEWLPKAWQTMGGRYISTCADARMVCTLPIVMVRPDVWTWESNHPRSIAAVLGDIYAHITQRGHAGLVLHPRIMTADFQATFVALLDFLTEVGVPFGRISERATLPAELLQ